MSWTPTPLYAFVAERADTRGDAQALVTTTARLNYRDQHAAVRRAAKAMYALGVRRGDFIGILMGNSETWVTLFYAAATIGAVTVPINTRFKSAELAFCLAQADVKVLFTADRFLNIDFLSFLRAAEPAIDHALPGDALPLLHGVVVVGSEIPRAGLRFDAFLALGEDITDDVLDRLAAQVQPSDLLLIQFTSGTTAYPKAVMLTHDNMLRNAWAVGQRMGIRPDDRYFNCRPFFHVAGTTLSLLVALVAGACLVTLPTFEAEAALRMMAQERCTLTSGNDTLFQLMMGHPSFDPALLCLRGGWAAAGPETIRNIIEKMGAREICVAYGLSEASPNVVLNDHRDPPDLRIAGLAKPHDGVEVRITRRDTGAALPAGETGEIEVRGWNVMRGYYKNPEANGQGAHARGLVAHRRHRCPHRRRPAAHGRAGQGYFPGGRRERGPGRGRGGAARASRRRDRAGRRRSRPPARRGRCRVRHAQGQYAGDRERADRIRAPALRQFPGAALCRDRCELRRHRHDRERQGAEERAAPACDPGIQARRSTRRRGNGTMSDVVLCECFARDGLQHETAFVPTQTKRALIERFAELGFARVEATSYSNPKVVPQFADASELLASLERREGVHYKATCANVRAVERALADLDAGRGVTEISLLVSASEAHSMKNLKQSRPDQWENVRRMAAAAQGRFRLIGTISVAFGCPFEGPVDANVVVADAIRFGEIGRRPRRAR